MEAPIHPLTELFAQLGLDNTDKAIDAFIRQHKPLPKDVELYNAAFWNASQASFLKQVKGEDADWTEIADHLDAMLR